MHGPVSELCVRAWHALLSCISRQSSREADSETLTLRHRCDPTVTLVGVTLSSLEVRAQSPPPDPRVPFLLWTTPQPVPKPPRPTWSPQPLIVPTTPLRPTQSPQLPTAPTAPHSPHSPHSPPQPPQTPHPPTDPTVPHSALQTPQSPNPPTSSHSPHSHLRPHSPPGLEETQTHSHQAKNPTAVHC